MINILKITDQEDGGAIIEFEIDKAARDMILSDWLLGVIANATKETLQQSSAPEVSEKDGIDPEVAAEAAEQRYLGYLLGEDNHLIPMPTDEQPDTGKRHKKRKHKKG